MSRFLSIFDHNEHDVFSILNLYVFVTKTSLKHSGGQAPKNTPSHFKRQFRRFYVSL